MSLSASLSAQLRSALGEYVGGARELPLLLYSTASSWPPKPSSAARRTDTTHIAVLDSSFNPPSHAHLALALAAPQPTAHLLLFSAKNADKGAGRVGDVRVERRLDLLVLLAHALEERLRAQGHEPHVAVALVKEPLMASKSTLLHDYLSEHGFARPSSTASTSAEPSARLHWLVGTDTLVRFFEPKYYGGEAELQRVARGFFDEERTTFICARRPQSDSQADRDEEEQMLRRPLIAPRVESGDVSVVDVKEAQGISSTAVRDLLKGKADETRGEELRKLVPDNIAEYLEQHAGDDLWIAEGEH
jgi:nicotinamide-nucleotide adenylyltransferase